MGLRVVLKFVAVCMLSSLGSVALAEQVELRGAELVSALDGKSFACDFGGAHMSLKFGRASKNGAVSYSGDLGGDGFKGSYRLNKVGRYSKGNTERVISRDENDRVIIAALDLPATICTPK